MSKTPFHVALIALSLPVAFAQGPLIQSRTIVIDRVIETSEPVPTVVLPVKCSLDGNIYVRIQEGDLIGRGPVLRFSSDGKRVTRYSIEGITPEAKELRIRSFTVGDRGDVHMLIEKDSKESLVAHFDVDGRLQSTHRIEAEVRATHIGAFGNGDLLISGFEAPLDAVNSDLSNPKPYVGLFRGNGQLVKRIILKRNVEPRAEVRETAAGEKYTRSDREYESTVALSTSELGGDGTLYFMRRSPTGPIFTISPAGVVKKALSLSPPPEANLSDIKISHGQLAAKYIRNKAGSLQVDAVIILVYDLIRGSKIAEYQHSDPKIGLAFGCHSSDGPVFLGNSPRQMFTIVHTKIE